MFRPKILLTAIVSGALLSACVTAPIDNSDPNARTKRGAAIGAAIGALAGVFVGDGEADEILGGAAVGAGIGAGIGVYMDKQQRELEQIEGAQVERLADDTLQVHFDSDILFAIDSALLGMDSRLALDDFSYVMNDYPQTAIVIQGHTDSTGGEEYNQHLSERRANSVYNHLVGMEVNPDRMVAIGYGESTPVASNETAEGRSYNRRVSILVKGKR